MNKIVFKDSFGGLFPINYVFLYLFYLVTGDELLLEGNVLPLKPFPYD